MQKFVFDIGNVLAVFDGPALCLKYMKDQKKASQVYDLLFPDLWNQYDQGILSEKQIVDRLSKELPEYRIQIETMMEEWPALLQINRRNLEFVSQIKEDCYILSNIPEKAEREMKEQGLFKPFKGALCSWREKLIKPDPAIFEVFLKQNHLKAEECVFIDDRKENVDTACTLGMQGIVLPEINQLEEVVTTLQKPVDQ